MDLIEAFRVDETKVFIKCESGIKMELYEHFSFFVPNYQHMPMYKNRLWDGKVRQFDLRSSHLPYGLLHKLNKFAKDRSYKLVLDKSIISNLRSEPTEDINRYIDSLPLHSKGEALTIRDYQREAVVHSITNNRSVLISPTGSGKSLIIYLAVRWFLQASEAKCLIIVPTTSLVSQMTNDFLDYSSNDDSFGEKDIHQIYSGKEKSSPSRITISTWQSIYKLPRNWFDCYEMVVGDECHLFQAKSLTKVMNNLINAWFRIGTTGTLDGSQVSEYTLEGCFGPINKVTTTKQLIDNETLSDVSIEMINLIYPPEVKKSLGKKTYHDEIDFLVSNPIRNRFIKNLAVNQIGNTLVLFAYVDKHGKPLYDLIKAAAKNTNVHYVSGETGVDDRERIRKLMDSTSDIVTVNGELKFDASHKVVTTRGDVVSSNLKIGDELKNGTKVVNLDRTYGCIIVASYNVFSTGVNIKFLHNIIFASPTKSQIRVLQSIGRSLRKAPNGQSAKIYDITDDLSWKSRSNYALKHGVERMKLYIKEKFRYKVHQVELPSN